MSSYIMWVHIVYRVMINTQCIILCQLTLSLNDDCTTIRLIIKDYWISVIVQWNNAALALEWYYFLWTWSLSTVTFDIFYWIIVLFMFFSIVSYLTSCFISHLTVVTSSYITFIIKSFVQLINDRQEQNKKARYSI